MTPPTTSTAKDLVLSWVRSKNPQLSDHVLVYAVQYSNYHPPEYDSLYSTKKEAEKRLSELKDSMWQISEEKIFYLPDMGLQEFVIALRGTGALLKMNGELFQSSKNIKPLCTFDLRQNLHNQEPKFYEDILPLLPHSAC